MSAGSAISIRVADPSEAEALVGLWEAAGSSPGSTDTVPDVTAAIDYPGATVLVAESAGRIVGSLFATWDGWRGNLYRLAVLPDHRRAGIATALVRDGERRLREPGARRLSALVLADEPVAAAFWEQAAYSVQGQARRFTKVVQRRFVTRP